MIDINTIILRHGTGEVAAKGDSIWGIDNEAKEIKRWNINQEEEAIAELAKHQCRYWEETTFSGGKVLQADEWALEYCECDEDGDFIQGSNFTLAEEK